MATPYDHSTQPGQFDPTFDRRAKPVRMKYSPEITLGNISTIVTLLAMLLGAYGIYVKDNQEQDSKISTLETNRVADNLVVKESLNKLEASVAQMQASLTTLDKNVAIINAKTGNK